MRWSAISAVLAVASAAAICRSAAALGQSHEIDAEHSTLLVHVYRAGLFAFAGDNHQISAPIARGSLTRPLESVQFTVNAAALTVLDPQLGADRRARVQERMLSADVLDPARFPIIDFKSTRIDADGANAWLVTGALTLHGVTKSIRLRAVESNDGHFRGWVTLRQSDFGMTPITIAGGFVKVKDEVRIDFDVTVRSDGR